MLKVRAASLAILLAGATAEPEAKACAACGPAMSGEDAEEAVLLQHRSKANPTWYVARTLCEETGIPQQSWVGQCVPYVDNPLWRVKFTCPSGTIGNITSQLFTNEDCSGAPTNNSIAQGVCKGRTNHGIMYKYTCYSVEPVAQCFAADFHQYNKPGESHEVTGENTGEGLIFSWLDGGLRKMVLTDLQGNVLETGYVNAGFGPYTISATWQGTERPVPPYSITNFRTCGD